MRLYRKRMTWRNVSVSAMMEKEARGCKQPVPLLLLLWGKKGRKPEAPNAHNFFFNTPSATWRAQMKCCFLAPKPAGEHQIWTWWWHSQGRVWTFGRRSWHIFNYCPFKQHIPHKFSGCIDRNTRYSPQDFKERSKQATAFPLAPLVRLPNPY